jgi:Sulfotransferase domain
MISGRAGSSHAPRVRDAERLLSGLGEEDLLARLPASKVRPDFFIVGAFKSGTTALWEYLRRHPQVFMPFHKEPNFFGDDLTRHYGRLSMADYLALFRDAQPAQRVGEASTWYLYSSSAAREIAEFSPEAQIIVLLRNPIDVMYAQHSQLLFRADENLTDFATALAAEPARHRGEELRPPPLRPETLFYRESVQFAEQLGRYFDVFGRGRVHVAMFDDLVADTAATYRAVLEFLGLDPTFRPDFTAYNQNRRVRFGRLQRLVYRPPGPLLGAANRLRRFPFVHRLRDAVLRLNTRAGERQAMDPDLRRELLAEFSPEIERLSGMIGRDLSVWRE